MIYYVGIIRHCQAVAKGAVTQCEERHQGLSNLKTLMIFFTMSPDPLSGGYVVTWEEEKGAARKRDCEAFPSTCITGVPRA